MQVHRPPLAATTAPATTEAPTEAPTTEEPTTEPAPVYTNPLNGKTLDAPFTGRIYAVSISNIRGALPHYGTMNADILMEMWVNGSIIRDLALFTDPTQSEAIGSVRSVRPMFNEIAKHYDAVIFDAGGSEQALGHAKKLGVDRFNIDTQKDSGYSFRNTDRAYLFKNESGWEHWPVRPGRSAGGSGPGEGLPHHPAGGQGIQSALPGGRGLRRMARAPRTSP